MDVGRSVTLGALLVATPFASSLAQLPGPGGPSDCMAGPFVEERVSVPVRSVDAGLSRDLVARALLRERGRLGHCASVAFERSMHAPLEVQMTFDILPDGSTRDAAIRAHEGPAGLGDCLKGAVGRITFPTPTSAQVAHVEVTLRFAAVRRERRCGVGM